MNDFERKLSQQPFRAPPPDLRDAILGVASNVVVPARWTWRDWFWPSPQAWGALAALWLIFAALTFGTDDAPPSSAPIALQSADSVSLLTFHQARALDHVLEYPN